MQNSWNKLMSRRQLPLFPSQPATPQDITKRTPIGATFDYFRDFLTKEGKSEHTIKAFMGDMGLLIEHTSIETPIGDYTTSMLNDYLHWMEFKRGVPCSRKTYARRVTTLKVFFKWLKSLNAIPDDPAKPVLQRSGPAPLSQVLDADDIKSAIHASRLMKKGDNDDTRPELLFRLLLETGIKKSESARLKLEDIDRSNPQAPMIFIKHTTRNVYKERRIPISADLLKALDAYVQQYQPSDAVFTCTTRNLEYILTDIGEEADIPFKLSFEVMRWTSALHDYLSGHEEETIREKLGLSRTSWYETSQKIKRLASQVTGKQFDEQ
jgi:site-specific recombinase XerD